MPGASEHMKEAWKLSRNPFPAEAIRVHNTKQPYSGLVFPEETQEFRTKFIASGIKGGQAIGFLWSQGKYADTGFGKTTLMQEMTREINADLGAKTLERAGASGACPAIAAAYTNLNNLNANGIYPVLFNAVGDLTTSSTADADSVIDLARARIIEDLGNNNIEAIIGHVSDAWAEICGTSLPLNRGIVEAFARGGGAQLKAALGRVSATQRIRKGLTYLDCAVAILFAAKIPHLFLMIDQLEDLATNRSISGHKRSREVAIIRDLLETTPYATQLHLIFTFHNRAAQVLDRYWEEARLPRFEVSASNTASVVVLSGLRDAQRAQELVRVYLEVARIDAVEDDLLPFEPPALEVLCEVADGRTALLLNRARELLHGAAEQGLPKITAEFARQYFDNQTCQSEDTCGPHETQEDMDDLLLNSRGGVSHGVM